ncbi:imidazole glycerol phosphate synthase subunit HisF [Flaviaesturariibacter flavus]|uniref:Imidazole glycerol phosphate synthase subunit HisF n=1 Tax=Flaviaesturariibacter flavus TaxID=2502780 RepID=A0A4R1BB47_9BACT|nr:HisA/HisF-related TIM barrel protein [Flaviaesturariibacter flavus]TCJ14183.1 imidazole glycerol phosphate synthase subunit HisF [Flaviaesturariibacter flavus]
MLKKRIAACLPVYNGVVVQSIRFNKYLPVGRPPVILEFLNKWGIDDVMMVDITARKRGERPDFGMYRLAAQRCQVPLAIGGGINDLHDVEELIMRCGADKVSFNRALFTNTELITAVAKGYGDQCAVVSIDAVKTDDGYRVFNYLDKSNEAITPADAARKAVDLGAGEILINSVDRDGTYTGYDLELIRTITDAVHVPVIAAGGARNANDMLQLLNEVPVSAAAAGNFFHFTEHSVNITKRHLLNNGVDLRLETHADYAESTVDESLRLLKKSDSTLENLLYIHIEKEII